MDDNNGYAVFFFPQALEALGEVIKPFLREGAAGQHVVCRTIDTGGAMFKMDLDGRTTDGDPVALEVMIPGSMVRMIVSARIEEAFGFGPRIAVSSLVPAVLATPASTPANASAPTEAASPAAAEPASGAAAEPGTPPPAAVPKPS